MEIFAFCHGPHTVRVVATLADCSCVCLSRGDRNICIFARAGVGHSLTVTMCLLWSAGAGHRCPPATDSQALRNRESMCFYTKSLIPPTVQWGE